DGSVGAPALVHRALAAALGLLLQRLDGQTHGLEQIVALLARVQAAVAVGDPELGDLPALLGVERDMNLDRLLEELGHLRDLLRGVAPDPLVQLDMAADELDVHGSPFPAAGARAGRRATYTLRISSCGRPRTGL